MAFNNENVLPLNVRQIINEEIEKERILSSPLDSLEKTLYSNNYKRVEANSSITCFVDGGFVKMNYLKNVDIVRYRDALELFDNNQHIVVIISTNGAKMVEQSVRFSPKNNELFVWIEINDKGNWAGSVMRLRCGSDFSSNKNIPFGKILDYAKDKKVNLKEKDILFFLNKELYKENQKKTLFFKIVDLILNSSNIVFSVAFDKLSDFVGGTIPDVLDHLKISNSRWDPTHKDYPTQGLFREELENIRQKSKNETEKTSKIKELFKSFFVSSLKSILEKGDGFIKDLNKYAMMSSNISKKIEYFWDKVGKNALDFISQFESLIDALDTIADTIIKSLIAYICGLINGIVEFIMGTFELIGMICKSASFVLDISKNKADAIDWVVEMAENLTDMIDKIDLSDYFAALGTAMKNLFHALIYNLKNIDKIKIKASDFIKFAYFCGYFVGFVVGVILEAFLTGGVAAVKELVQFFKAGVSRASRGIRSLGKRSLDSMKAFSTFFDDLFRQVTKDPKALFERFKQWLDELIQAIKKELGLVDEVFDFQKIIDDFNVIRKDFKNADLKALWRAKVSEVKLSTRELKTLYNKRIKKFPGLENYHNQAEFRTIIKNKGKQIEDVKEYFISGDRKRLYSNFGDPPNLPDDLIEILDDYENFSNFARGAIDKSNRFRNFDSELKYIFNFIKKHANKGDEFIVDISSLIKVCDSCSRELLMLEEYLIYRGKTIKFIIKHDKEIDGFKDLLNKIKI